MSAARVVITQGEHAVSADPDQVVSTLLGSCVACCLWDPLARVGGINHMLVTQLHDTRAVANESGVHAMEVLINDILKHGGARARLQAKVFGGAQMISGLPGIGAANVAFTLDYLAQENLPCLSKSTGGQFARHVLFWPAKGVAQQRFVAKGQPDVVSHPSLQPPKGTCNGPELF